MPIAQTPFSLSGELRMPLDTGQPDAPIPFKGTGAFASRQHSQLRLSGAGTHEVSLGSVGIPGAKVLLLEMDPDAAGMPISVAVNGAAGTLELSPGGFLLYHNPSPQGGVVGLSITHATDALVRIWVLG